IYYESLSFRYYYRENQEVNRMTKDTIYHKKGDWVYQYSNIDSYSLTSSNDPSQLFKVFWKLKTTEVSEKIADSILNSWGLKRKNY
ncbi:hypothetical protein, partial [uncultured Winogradskyella sp.]|uniref:hypothetical protein n=1 Tax=uncultured Winogradskyella sp. TaxID=395353 RepID=UPI0026260C2D